MDSPLLGFPSNTQYEQIVQTITPNYVNRQRHLRAVAFFIFNCSIVSAFHHVNEVVDFCHRRLDLCKAELSVDVWKTLSRQEMFLDTNLGTAMSRLVNDTAQDADYYLAQVKPQYPYFYEIFIKTNCFTTEYNIDFSPISSKLKKEHLMLLKNSNGLVVDIDNFVCAILKNQDIQIITMCARDIMKKCSIYNWTFLFSVLGETIFQDLKNISKELFLPSNNGILTETFLSCGINFSMPKEFAGLVQSFYIYNQSSECHLLRLANLLHGPSAAVLVVREIQCIKELKISSTRSKIFQETALFCINFKFGKTINFSNDILPETIPLFSYILMVQLLLLPLDPDISFLRDIVLKKNGSKATLHAILQKHVPVDFLLLEIKNMFTGFADLITTIMEIPCTANIEIWIKFAASVLRDYSTYSCMTLYQLFYICIEAKYFISSDKHVLSMHDILKSIAWLWKIDLAVIDMEIFNPFSRSNFKFDLVEESTLDFCQHMTVLLGGSSILVAKEFRQIIRNFGLPFSCIVNWYNTNGRSSVPPILLQRLFEIYEMEMNPLQQFTANLDSPSLAHSEGLGTQILFDLKNEISNVFKYGPMLAFFSKENETWNYYVPGIDLNRFSCSESGYYPVLFGGLFLIYIRVHATHFDFFLLPTEFYQHEQELSAEKLLRCFVSDTLVLALSLGITSLFHSNLLLGHMIDLYLELNNNTIATKLDAIYCLQLILDRYLTCLNDGTIINGDILLGAENMQTLLALLSHMTLKKKDTYFNTEMAHALYSHARKSQQLLSTLADFIDQCEFVSTDVQYSEITNLLAIVKNHNTI